MVCQGLIAGIGSCWNFTCFCCNMCTKNNVVTIPTGNAGIKLKAGLFDSILPAGIYYINKCIEEIKLVNIKTQIVDILRVQLMTREQIAVQINAYVAYKIVDPFQASFGVQGLESCIFDVASSILKNIISRNTLSDILRK